MPEEVARRDYDKIVGAILIVSGVLTAIIGGSLVWFEAWRHMLSPAKGPRR